MNRTVLIIVFGLFALVAGTFVILNLRGSRPEPATAVVGTAPPAAPTVKPPPTVATPERAPERPTASARRAPTPVAPAPAPASPVEEVPETGTLRIESDVPGAQVFIDREYVGATPVTAENITPGTHRLNVSAQGYEGIAETIEVTPGPRDVQITFKEVRLDLKMDVVHKHRLGSCRGSLIATPKGLRYDTTDKDDVFNSPLLTLQTFEVDYLEKRLRVKLDRGRQYDFTDPQGNADRLFVFHRDVEKARTRLKNGDPPANP